MKQVRIGLDNLDVFKRLVDKGYVIGNSKQTRQIAYALTLAKIPKCNGYEQDTKKIVLALERRIRAVSQKKTLKSVFFKIEEI